MEAVNFPLPVGSGLEVNPQTIVFIFETTSPAYVFHVEFCRDIRNIFSGVTRGGRPG